MIWTLFVILLVAWVLAMLSAGALGGFTHLLLALALAIALLHMTQRRTV
jgi:hypothetical protein